MAGSEPMVSPIHRFEPQADLLGEWIAPLIAFIVLVGMLVALISCLLGPAE